MYEDFISTRVEPGLQPVARAFVALVAKAVPDLEAGMRGGTDKYIPVPVWRLGRDLMVLSPSKKGLTVSFANGAMMDDPAGLLGGAGKVSRTLLLRTTADVARPELLALLKQVVPLARR